MRAGSGPRRLFVDSGAWIALFSRRDQYHPDADAGFTRAVAESVTLLTTDLVLAEVHRFLLFRAGIRPALRALETIAATPELAMAYVTAETDAAAKAWLTRLDDQAISYTDATSFAVIETTGCDAVFGFDHDFEIAGFTLWRPR